MNFSEILSPEAQKFIQENSSTPVEELVLRSKKYPTLNIPLLVSQIEGKNKAKKKLPSWWACEKIIYPVKLSMEQCSSELTAAYKASLLSGDTLVDLTGGFGVDCAAFAEKMKKVIYVERNAELAAIATHNFGVLKKNNIEVLNTVSEDFISNFIYRSDWIFIDPARRKEGSKVFRFADCEPDVLKLQKALFKMSDRILIKTSPLLDIDQAVKELGYVKEIHVLAVDNECKELLFILEEAAKKTEPEIIAVNIRKEIIKDAFQFNRKKESEAEVKLSLPLQYLYEPNAAILKAGAFKSIAVATGLYKLNASSHLYTSGEYQESFPGRAFRILKIVKYSKKEILPELPEGKANITTRNFPDTVEDIRKKTGIKDGGSVYLFATKDLYDKPVILLTEKIN
jgi:hypothetical protein